MLREAPSTPYAQLNAIRVAGKCCQRIFLLVVVHCFILSHSCAQESRPQLIEQAGHSASVDALAFTPDGKWLISAGHDFSVRLWDLTNGRQVGVLGMHLREVNALAACPDSRCVVSGGQDQALKLWEIPSGRLLRSFVGQTASVYCAVFSSDGRQLISGSGDPPNFENRKPDFSIRVWDVSSGRQLRKFDEHLKTVASVDLSRDGNLLVTGSLDGTVKIWDFKNGKVLRTIGAFDEEVRAQFSSDAAYLVTASRGSIELWEVSTGRHIKTLARDARPYKVVFRPAKLELAYLSEENVKLLAGTEGRQTGTLASSSKIAQSLAYSVDGRWIASGYAEGTIKLWDADTHKETYDLSGYAARVDSMAVSPTGQWLASGNRDATVKLWNAQSGQLVRSLKSENDEIPALAFSYDGSRIAASGEKYSTTVEAPVELWDVGSGRRLARFSYSVRRIDFVAFSPDGRWLAASAPEGTTKIWDLQREVEVQTLSPAHKVVAFAPDGSWVVTGSLDNALTFWALPSGRLIKKIPDIAWAFTMSPDGRWLASTGFLRDFKVWDIGSVAQWSKNHSDPNVLFSWNSTSRRSEHRFKGHREFVSDVAFSPDSRTVVSGSWDGDLKLWDPASGREIRTLSGHTSGIVRVAFSPDGKHIFSGAWDGTIRVWDAATGEQSVSLSAGRGSEDWLAIAPDGLFDGTSDAMQQVAWKMSGTSQSVPLDAFFTDFYHPGLLAEILANNRPRAQFDIATEIQVPGLRLMLRQKLAHLENRSSGIAVCFDQTPGTAIDVGPTDQRIFFPPVNGYGPGTTSTCKFEKLLPTSIANSNTLTAQLLKPNSDVFTTPWDGRLSATSGSTLHVLTVAVSQYPSISGFDRLPYAVPSARALEEFFRAQQVKGTKPYAMVRVWNSLLDQDATRGSIKQTLSLMAKEVKEDDVVLLYLAGHGQMSLQEEMFYFVPVDGQTGKLRSTAVSTAMIAQALRDMPARRMVLIVDACQAGGAIEALSKVGVVKAQAEQRGLQLAQNPAGHEQGIGVHLIAATLPLSYAIGLRDGRSVLATTLLEGLESPSRTFTAAQLSTYIREHLPVISERAMHGFRQVPLTVAIGLDFPLALAQKAADAQPRQSLGPQNSPRTAGPVTQMNQNSGAGPISPATGYLTIRSHSPDTAIQVTTLGQFYGDWIDHPCAPGTYVVIASREGMRTEQRTVVVEASKHVAIDFHLSSDSAAALANNLSGQTIGAPTVTPDSSGATTSSEVVSSSYLSAGGYTEFQKAANQALRKGGTVTIDLVHEHVGAAGDSIHPVTLTLTARTLTYLPGTSSCKYSTFTVPLEKIETIEVTNKVVEGKIIGIVVRHLAAGTFLLHLQLRDPARSNERINLFLATPDSQIVKYPNNVKYLASPEQSSKTLDSLADLMRNTRATITWK